MIVVRKSDRSVEVEADIETWGALINECLHFHIMSITDKGFSRFTPSLHHARFQWSSRSPLGRLRPISWTRSSRRRRECHSVRRSGFQEEYPAPKTEQLCISLDGKDRELIFETGGIGRQANGSVMARYGDTVIYATVCCDKEKQNRLDFVPLSVDYVEKLSSVGKTALGFVKRERQRENEILTSRLVDRSIRPMFPDGWTRETQVLETVMSYDGTNSAEPLAITAAGAALAISDIPFLAPVVGVRVGWIEKPIVNPTTSEQEKSKLDLVLAGSDNSVVMLEGSGDLIQEQNFIEAFKEGVKYINEVSERMKEWVSAVGKQKMDDGIIHIPPELEDEVWNFCKEPLQEIFSKTKKRDRNTDRKELWVKVEEQFLAPDNNEAEYSLDLIKRVFKKCESRSLREKVKNGTRIDGRRAEDIRPIYCSANVLPRTHGSAVFTRGNTQALCVATLGSQRSAQKIQTLQEEDVQRFYLQYFFPPSSVGEVRRFTLYPGRREIGHGHLASLALSPSVPEIEDFPYTIRLESTITESDGSSSMASVCGGYLAMMDAGVPMTTPIAGIAMGLMLNDDGFITLSDMLGTEDALGDMDLKIAGSKDAITAVQMDVKVKGLSPKILLDAVRAARKGRRHILTQMMSCAPAPNNTLSQYAPHIKVLRFDPELTGRLIGIGGKNIKAVAELSGVQTIQIDEDELEIIGPSFETVAEAERLIGLIVGEIVPGQIIKGCVVNGIKQFGAFVDLAPGRSGLIHISELAAHPIQSVDEEVNVGDKIDVQVMASLPNGKFSLSRKALLVQNEELNNQESALPPLIEKPTLPKAVATEEQT
eukprot:g1089.t1